MELPQKQEVESTEVLVEDLKKWPQYLAAGLATLFAVSVGTVDGWTSPALPYLQEPEANSTFRAITDDEASWIGSLAPLGALVGAIPAGYLANILGRKQLLLSLSLPLIVGWVLIIVAGDSLSLLYGARFVLGLACGAATVVTPLYNEEIAETRVRGALGVNLDIMFNVGILYIYILGALVPYFWLAVAALFVPVASVLSFFWMPESPVFLLSKGHAARAEKSLRWLRGANHGSNREIQLELGDMKKYLTVSQTIKEEPERPPPPHTTCRYIKDCLGRFTLSSPTVKAVNIICGLMIFQTFSGIDVVIYYTVDIFNDAGTSLSPFVCTIIVGVVQLVATCIPSRIVDRAGRRILLLVSSLGMAVSLFLLALHFYALRDKLEAMPCLGWIPLVAVNAFMVAFSVGFGPLPWLMMAELLTTDAKVWVSSLSVCLNWSLTFAVTKLFPIVNRDLGPAVSYGGFSAICLLGAIFVAWCVPETQGKSREDIQLELVGK